MKIKPFYFLCLIYFLFFSCSKESKTSKAKQHELEITNQINGQVVFGINAILDKIRTSTRNSGNLAKDIKILNSSEGIADWKEVYLNDRNQRNLLTYTESILNLEEKNYRKIRYGKINGIVIKKIISLKNELTKSDDSLTQSRLFFWTLKAESDYLKNNASRISNYFKRHGHVVSLINSKKLVLGDSTYIAITNFNNCLDYYVLKPISSIIINKNTNEKFVLKPVQLAMQCIFHFTPTKRGNYEFQGKFLLDKSETGDPKDDTIGVIQEFEVR